MLDVKGNQPTLENILIDLPAEAFGPWTELTERNKGRNEQRRIAVAEPPPGFSFPHANQVYLLERNIRDDDGNLISAEAVTGVTDLGPAQASPAQLLAYKRGHWGIEAHHNIRDVTFKEDASKARTGAAPQVMATLRNAAILILDLAGWQNKAAGLRDLARNTLNQRALDLLGI
jgi:hypothetical protein